MHFLFGATCVIAYKGYKPISKTSLAVCIFGIVISLINAGNAQIGCYGFNFCTFRMDEYASNCICINLESFMFELIISISQQMLHIFIQLIDCIEIKIIESTKDHVTNICAAFSTCSTFLVSLMVAFQLINYNPIKLFQQFRGHINLYINHIYCNNELIAFVSNTTIVEETESHKYHTSFKYCWILNIFNICSCNCFQQSVFVDIQMHYTMTIKLFIEFMSIDNSIISCNDSSCHFWFIAYFATNNG